MTDKYDRAALLAELVAQMGPEPVREDEVTSEMVAAATGLARVTCSEYLNRQVFAGAMSARDARGANGRRVKAYRKVRADG